MALQDGQIYSIRGYWGEPLTDYLYLSYRDKCGWCRQIYDKAHYAASEIAKLPQYKVHNSQAFFQEFVIECPNSPESVNDHLLAHKVIGGLDVSSIINNGMLLCFSEMNTKKEIDHLVQTLKLFGK